MEINGKKIEIETNIPFGLFRKFSTGLEPDEMSDFLVQITGLSKKEIDKIPIDSIFEIMVEFKERFQEKQSFLEKKLSR